VVCWGYNGNGQLGDGTGTSRNRPVLVPNLFDVVSIATGFEHTCAVRRNGTVWCWGYNVYGQLGDGTATSTSIPVMVPGFNGAVEVSCGAYHTCVRLTSGQVRCWGYNASGQLGDNSVTTSYSPVVVDINTTNSVLTGAVQLTSGDSHTCARLGNGTVLCWGLNSNGQLGDNSVTTRRFAVPVSSLSGVNAVGASFYSTCGVLSDTTLRCWGRNSSYQVGDGTTTQRLVPTVTLPLTVNGTMCDAAPGYAHER
jgi:hypothetical protein